MGREPKHGNLIPEFERIVGEGQPDWFVMENVPPAPEPIVEGYGVMAFLLCPTKIADSDGFGHEQRRRRRFSFGVRGGRAPDLRQFIAYAALELAETAHAVTADPRETPIRIGGSGKVKQRTVRGKNDGQMQPWERAKARTVLGSDGGPEGYRRPIGEMCRLQGFPEDFTADWPFTMEAKRQLIGNGVPMAMGRAVARAVRQACPIA